MNLDVCSFCEGFYHVEESIEINVPRVCLCNKPCSRKTVRCIARLLNNNDEELQVSFFKNERSHNHMTIHAEKLLVSDKSFSNIIRSNKECRKLILYMTYQPCHYSGGHQRPLLISCTEELIKYNKEVLKPYNVQLQIKTAYIYRAFWQFENSHPKYWKMINNAKEGMRLLRVNNITVDAFNSEDWDFVKGLCDDDTKNILHNIPICAVKYREITDTFNYNFFNMI